MKYFFLFLLSPIILLGQSLSVFDIDTTYFPTIKAKFYAFDAGGNQLLNLSPSDFEVTENGIQKVVTSISCPQAKPTLDLSSVLTIDVSGSMSGNGLNIAKGAAKMWVSSLPLGKSECAITSFNSVNYFNQDFTTDSNKLINAINSLNANDGTDFNAGFINQMAGALLAVENGKNKRVVVFLTDGQASGNESAIIQKANKINATVYCVILNSKCPQILKNISTQTGGQWFENITNEKQAKDVYMQILQIAQEGNPCEINWETNVRCKPDIRNVELRLLPQNLVNNIIYSQPENILAELQIEPPFLYFINKAINIQHDTTITFKALYSDFVISDISSTNNSFKITPNSFELKEGDSITLILSYTPTDSSYTYTQFNFENTYCPVQYFAFGGFVNKKAGANTLKVTHPNGGEIFVVGSDTIITWEGIPPDEKVKLEYSNDNGITWKLIQNTATDLEYKWNNIQKPASNKCLVRVKQLDSAGETDNSKFTWQRTYGGTGTDAATSIQETNDKGFVVAGWTNSNDGDVTGNSGIADYWILKTDADGNIRMQKTLGGSQEDHATSIIQTYDNGIAVAGYAYSTDADVSGNKGNGDFWIVKLGDDGNIQSEKTFGGTERDFASSIYQTLDSGFVVAGYTNSNNGNVSGNKGSGDAWVIKLDKNLNLQWQKTLGGTDYDIANSIRQTFDGGYILVGETWSNDGDVPGNKGESDFFVVKLKSDGEILWKKNFGGSDVDVAWSVQETFYGGLVVAGETWSTDGEVTDNKGMGDFWVIKLNTSGVLQWQKTLGGSNYDIATSIDKTWDAGFIIAGSTESNDCDVTNYNGNIDCWVVKLNNSGTIQWQKTLGGSSSENAYSVQQVSDGGFVMAGYTNSNDGDVTENRGTSDFWIVKLPAVESILQEDISDNVFSIVAPVPVSCNIDMGKVLVNQSKDSLVTDFIKNTGSWKFSVDSIYFVGADAKAFSLLSGFPKYDVLAGENHVAELRFSPKESRIYRADLVIITQSDTLHQSIKGEGIEEKIQIANNMINFGKVYLGYQKDTVVTTVIKNISSTPLNISSIENSGPDKSQFTVLDGAEPFSLNAGESKEMRLRFSAKELGRTSGSIAFHYNGIGSPALVQLFGESYKIIPKITSNSPICTGHDLVLFADSIPNAIYHWSGPKGFTSNQQNITIKYADFSCSGEYKLYTTIDTISSDTTTTYVDISTDLVSPGDSSFIFVGHAERIDDYIKLTNAKIWSGGSIWLKNRFSIKHDFSTTFQFKVRYGDNNIGDNEKSVPGADGIAFVMQNHIYPTLGDKGGAMGYKGITNSLAVEIDMYQNEYDANGNHVAVQSFGALPNIPDHDSGATLGINNKMLIIEQDKIYNVKIKYEWTSKIFTIYIDSTEHFGVPILTINDIDLSSYLNLTEGEYVYLGLTSATGRAFQEHDIYNWVVPCNNLFIDVNDEKNISTDKNLHVYPNPLSDKTLINFYLQSNSKVEIVITDLLGIEIAKIMNHELLDSGSHSIEFDASDLKAGIYFCTFNNGIYTETVKFVVVK